MAGSAIWHRRFRLPCGPRRPCGNQNLLDIGEEQLAIDRAVERARCDQAILAEAGNGGRGVPVPVRYSINQPVAHLGPAVEPDHVRLGPGLVDEDQPARVQLGLVLALLRPGLGDARSILPGGPERLFLSDRPSNFNVCQISPTLAATWCVANATSAIPRSWYRHVRQHTRGSLCRPAPASSACGRAERARPSHPSCDAASAPSTHTQRSPAAARLSHQHAHHRPTRRMRSRTHLRLPSG